MSNKTAYTYTVLRYVHDIASGECLNVGVALLAPGHRYVNAMCRTSFARLKDVFPTLDGDAFRASMRHVTHVFERFRQELRDELPLSGNQGGVLVQCAALFCTYPAVAASAAFARVTLARMSEALAVQMNGLGSLL